MMYVSYQCVQVHRAGEPRKAAGLKVRAHRKSKRARGSDAVHELLVCAEMHHAGEPM